MTSRARWRQLWRIAALAVLGLVVCLFVIVRTQQYVLRWRAERLLDDIRQIQMGKSSWADAQKLMYRWGRWGTWVGTCNPDECEYQIALQDSLQSLPTFFWTDKDIQKHTAGREYRSWQLRLYSILGGRVAQVYAYIRVKGGIVWRKSYTVYTPRHFFADGFQDLLVGDAVGTTRFTPRMDWPMLAKHPEYSIMAAGPCEGCRDGACTICEMIRMHFSPYADPAIVDKFFQLNLSCISSWHECKEPREIAPAAWSLYAREREEQERTTGRWDANSWKRCDMPIERLGRDYRFALLTEVASIKTSPDSGLTRYLVSLREIRSLKNHAVFETGILEDALIGWSDSVLPGEVRVSEIKPGSRLVFLYDKPPDKDHVAPWNDVPPLSMDFCSYVPDTDANWAALQRGIERDKLADVP
jgi:hypothetical protein